MAESDEVGARLLGVEPPSREPSAATIALVRSALDAGGEDHLDAADFDDFVAALVRLAPAAAARLEAAGVTGTVLEDTFADVGRKIGTYGDDGIRGWAVELLRGEVVTLGRLQFERAVGKHGRHIHIPELGPLDPASVDDALERARRWFDDDAGFCCASWLLDERLAALGDSSNIVRFQRRFRQVVADDPEPPEEADRSVAKFVFRRSPRDAIALDPGLLSSLQRLVAEVLRSGGHWTEPLGILIP
jgi:hypothetical protein